MKSMARLAVCVSLGLRLFAASSDDVVRTESGGVAGLRSNGDNVRVFRSIPFAAPPVGTLRWRPPQPPAKWNGVRRADTFAPSCVQPPRTGAAARLFTSQRLGATDEDCLYLNVWTAADAREKLPVMVWFPGGGFASGGGSALAFDGEALARKHVVVVTTNYRLGVLGFFAHPDLLRESQGQATGNFGLMDQIAALSWVRRNIAAFGGDPNRITIFGQSAGATSVSYLMTMRPARGLFHRAIGESSGGTGGVFALDRIPTRNEAEQVAIAVAHSLGAASLTELRALPADRFVPASQNGDGRPMLDGRLVVEPPDVVFAAGRQHDVPLLAGSNADDGNGARRNFTDAYLKAFPQATPKDANVDAMAWRVRRWVDLQAKTGRSRAYLYYFTRPGPDDGPATGAYHGAEAPYVFGNLRLFDLHWSVEDRALEQRMSSYWANFAATGDPNGDGLARWPGYERTQDGRVMEFGDAVRLSESRLSASKIQWFDAFREALQ